METFSALLAFCGGEFTGHRWISQHKNQWHGAYKFSFDLCHKWLNKQSWGWWSETPSRSLWCHCNVSTKRACILLTDELKQLSYHILIHISLDKMGIIPLAIFSDTVLWMKICILIKMSLKLVPDCQHCLLNGWQAINSTNINPVHWNIYLSLRGDGLIFLLSLSAVLYHTMKLNCHGIK